MRLTPQLQYVRNPLCFFLAIFSNSVLGFSLLFIHSLRSGESGCAMRSHTRTRTSAAVRSPGSRSLSAWNRHGKNGNERFCGNPACHLLQEELFGSYEQLIHAKEHRFRPTSAPSSTSSARTRAHHAVRTSGMRGGEGSEPVVSALGAGQSRGYSTQGIPHPSFLNQHAHVPMRSRSPYHMHCVQAGFVYQACQVGHVHPLPGSGYSCAKGVRPPP